ncbi:MAG TPA: WXG100 family type VII secretion target [Mycobacteriales bacterium]|nr:WXG100 family type VII secretion target [Mycobacteriales bacterium]
MADLNVTYADLNDTAGKLRAGQQDMDQQLSSLGSQVQNLVSSGFQTDHASGAFHDTFTQFQTNLKQAIDALDSLASYLEQAAKAMEDTDTQLASAIQGQN